MIGKKINWKKVAYVLVLILLLVLAFVSGTAVGFDTAMKQISGCEKVKCSEIGINGTADRCEVCPDYGLEILKISR